MKSKITIYNLPIYRELLNEVRFEIAKKIHTGNALHIVSLALILFTTPFYSLSTLLSQRWLITFTSVLMLRSLLGLYMHIQKKYSPLLYNLIFALTLLIAIFWAILFSQVIGIWSFNYEAVIIFACIIGISSAATHTLRKDRLLCISFVTLLLIPTLTFLFFALEAPVRYYILPSLTLYALYTFRTAWTAGDDYWKLSMKIIETKQGHETLSEMEKTLFQTAKLATIGSLTSQIGHELNNPLTVIIGHTELALNKTSEPDYLKEKLRKILAAAERMRHTLNQLRIYHHHPSQEVEPVDLQISLSNVIALIDKQIALDDITLKSECFVNKPIIQANKNIIESILHNLIENARHALQTLTDGRSKFIYISITVLDKFYLCTINDNGPGIPAELRDEIFAAPLNKTLPSSSAGLTLSITKHTIEKFGGKIECHSVLNEGTHFVISLPRTSQA